MVQKIGHYALENPASVYDEEAMTALELAGRTAQKVNECIDHVNQIPTKIADDVQKHIDNGEFDKQVDKYAGELARQIEETEATLSANINTANQAMRSELDAVEESLGKRVDNLLNSELGEGSTTMDAEVIDGRLGADGVLYPNIGEANRNQFEKARMDTERVANKMTTGPNMANVEEFERGYYINANDGNKYPATDYFSSDFIPCKEDTNYSCRGMGHITVWDKNKNYLRGFLCYHESDPPFTLTFNTGAGGCYIRAGVELTTYNFCLVEGSTPPPYLDYINVVKNSALDDQQMERKRFIDGLMSGKHIITPVWSVGGMDAYGNDANTEYGGVTNRFSVPSMASRFYVYTKKPHFIVGLDSNGNRMWGMLGWSAEGATTEIENNCASYRVYTNLTEWCNIAEVERTAQIYYLDEPGGKKPYQDGYIFFTVKVNQTLPENGDTEELADVTCFVKLPPNYTQTGKPSKLIMVCHGAGQGITGSPNWTQQASYNALLDTFLNAGYAVFDCNGYNDTVMGQNFWGAHRGLECYRKAYDYVTQNYNVENNVNIYGFSMGGLTAMNLMFQKLPNIKAVACGSPISDLQKDGFEWGGTPNGGCAEAYGITNATYNPETVWGCDPTLRIVLLYDKETIIGTYPPVKYWWGSTEDGVDTTVNKAHMYRVVNALKNGGNIARYVEIEGAGHEICYGANPTVNRQILEWFNRFNN